MPGYADNGVVSVYKGISHFSVVIVAALLVVVEAVFVQPHRMVSIRFLDEHQILIHRHLMPGHPKSGQPYRRFPRNT